MILFRFTTLKGGTILSSAVYRGPHGPVLFLWHGRSVSSLRLREAPMMALGTLAAVAVVGFLALGIRQAFGRF